MEIPVERRLRRALVRVASIAEGPQGRELTVFVSRWRENEPILLTEAAFPVALRPYLKPGAVLIASVNTEATRREDLIFDDFEVVPEEGPLDGAP